MFFNNHNATSIEFLIFRLEGNCSLMLWFRRNCLGRLEAQEKEVAKANKTYSRSVDAVEELMENEPQIVKKRMIFEQAHK
jgi:hypothetical protein